MNTVGRYRLEQSGKPETRKCAVEGGTDRHPPPLQPGATASDLPTPLSRIVAPGGLISNTIRRTSNVPPAVTCKIYTIKITFKNRSA